jgi:hypothetical protein
MLIGREDSVVGTPGFDVELALWHEGKHHYFMASSIKLHASKKTGK